MLHADLVVLDSLITPHDLENLNAFVKPKLLEDSKDEGSKCSYSSSLINRLFRKRWLKRNEERKSRLFLDLFN